MRELPLNFPWAIVLDEKSRSDCTMSIFIVICLHKYQLSHYIRAETVSGDIVFHVIPSKKWSQKDEPDVEMSKRFFMQDIVRFDYIKWDNRMSFWALQKIIYCVVRRKIHAKGNGGETDIYFRSYISWWSCWKVVPMSMPPRACFEKRSQFMFS